MSVAVNSDVIMMLQGKVLMQHSSFVKELAGTAAVALGAVKASITAQGQGANLLHSSVNIILTTLSLQGVGIVIFLWPSIG